MSIILNQNTLPKGVEIKAAFHRLWITNPLATRLTDISLADFCALVQYVLTNEDLIPNDLRLGLVTAISKAKVVKGWNFGWTSERLDVEFPPEFRKNIREYVAAEARHLKKLGAPPKKKSRKAPKKPVKARRKGKVPA